MAYLDPRAITDLSIPSESPVKELPIASFSFEIRHSELKLWALKDIVAMFCVHAVQIV